MSHRILAPVALSSLRRLLETIFADETVRSSPRLTELASTAKQFLAEIDTELQGLVEEYDDLKAKLYPLEDGEKA